MFKGAGCWGQDLECRVQELEYFLDLELDPLRKKDTPTHVTFSQVMQPPVNWLILGSCEDRVLDGPASEKKGSKGMELGPRPGI
jgi:hypothetical protein